MTRRRSHVLPTLQQRVREGAYLYSEHARTEMQDEGISEEDVASGILNGRLVARQTGRGPGPRYVIRGPDQGGSELGLVVRFAGAFVRIITVYRI